MCVMPIALWIETAESLGRTIPAPLYARMEQENKEKSELTEAELDRELQKGFDDIAAGRTKPARQVFAKIRKDYGM